MTMASNEITSTTERNAQRALVDLRDRIIDVDQFCEKFMQIAASSSIVDDNYYNHIFDLCVRIEDKQSDRQSAIEELYALAGDD